MPILPRLEHFANALEVAFFVPSVTVLTVNLHNNPPAQNMEKASEIIYNQICNLELENITTIRTMSSPVANLLI
jgi:hypothetical protein